MTKSQRNAVGNEARRLGKGRLRMGDLLRASVVWTTLVVTFHGFMEWLFFVTKRSFLTPLGALEKLTVLLVGPLPLLLLALIPWGAVALLTLPWAVRGRRPAASVGSVLRILFALAPGFLLAASVFLLVENFTYTLFGVGAISTDGFGLQIYTFFFWMLFGGAILFLVDRLAHPVGGLFKAMPMILCAGCAGLALTLLEGGHENPAFEMDIGGVHEISEGSLPDIFLISGDGLEAAHLPIYGGEGVTPALSRLKGESLVFENVFTNSDRTAGSIPSVLTGRYPASNHKLTSAHALRGGDAYTHLPGLLRKFGYTALQLGPSIHADAHAWNLRQGFHGFNRGRTQQQPLEALADGSGGRLVWEFHFTEAMIDRVWSRLLHIFGFEPMENPAQANLDVAALEFDAVAPFLDDHPGPVFLQAHFMMTRAGTAEAVASFDANVGALVEDLKRRGRWQTALLVVWSDHGFDHGIGERLPLVVRLPEGRRPQVDLSATAQNLDIAPTILDVLGVPMPAWMEGGSLLRARAPRRPVVIVRADSHRPGWIRNAQTLGGPHAAAVVLCDQFHELDLSTGEMVSRPVTGHSAPCGSEGSVDGQAIRELLRAHLEERGYSPQ